MHTWHPVQIHRPRDNRWAACGVAALVLALLLFTIAWLEGCSGAARCTYDARFDGRVADPDNGVYPYYLVAECPGEATQTLVESATRLHIPE